MNRRAIAWAMFMASLLVLWIASTIAINRQNHAIKVVEHRVKVIEQIHTGPRGRRGPRSTVPGPRGSRGVAGPRGLVGPAGPRGLRGVVGPRGIQGVRGARGMRGFTGRRGPVGHGVAGPRGPQGATGATSCPSGYHFAAVTLRGTDHNLYSVLACLHN